MKIPASIIPDLFHHIDNQHLNCLSTHLIHYPALPIIKKL